MIVGSFDFYVYCIDGKTGELKWKHPTNRYVYASPAIGMDGTVFGTDGNGNGNDVYAISRIK